MSTVRNLNQSEQLLCCYINQTQNIQIAIIDSAFGSNTEKVIFPGERFLFKAPATGKLSIYVELAGETALLDSIPCDRLLVHTSLGKQFELVR